MRTRLRTRLGLAVALAALLAPAALRASALGSSGGLSVPDPETLPREEYQLQIYTEFFDETNLSTGAPDTTADVTFVYNFGVYDNLELGVRRKARVNTPLRSESLQITGKYRFPVDTYNVTFGWNIATSSPDWSSAYLIAGWKALYLGFGYNFGGQRIREFTRGQLASVGTASYGGYSLRTARNARQEFVFTGAPNDVFGMFGVNVKLSQNLRVLADFDGDRFTGGMRVQVKDVHIDAAYISQKEKDGLFDRQSQNFQFGLGVQF